MVKMDSTFIFYFFGGLPLLRMWTAKLIIICVCVYLFCEEVKGGKPKKEKEKERKRRWQTACTLKCMLMLVVMQLFDSL